MRELCLFGCKSLRALPADLGALVMLESIDLGLCESLKTLPPSYNALGSLRMLSLQSCKSLESLPPLGALQSLTELDLSHCAALRALPDGLASVSPNLNILRLHGCASLPLTVRMTSKRPVEYDVDEEALSSMMMSPQRPGARGIAAVTVVRRVSE